MKQVCKTCFAYMQYMADPANCYAINKYLRCPTCGHTQLAKEGHMAIKLNDPIIDDFKDQKSSEINSDNVNLNNDLKRCPNCKITKNKKEFYKSSERYDGCQSWCIECFKLRENRRKLEPDHKIKRRKAANKCRRSKKYGITPEQYEAMYSDQDGRCAGCLKHQDELPKSLAVDHCHVTNKVRGLLCDICNRALGLVYDDQETLKRLENYLDNARKMD